MSNIDKQACQVSRYDLVSGYMQKWPDGDFVYHSDYQALLDELEAAERRNAELEAREVTLPRPVCTYADHSYPAYSERQVVALLESLGIRINRED